MYSLLLRPCLSHTIQLIFARFLFLLCAVCTAETFSRCCCGSVDGAAVYAFVSVNTLADACVEQ